jgi:hypothetical protein
MNIDLTKNITDSNIETIRRQILQKQSPNPFYGTINMAENVITDMDVFPYTRFYRGQYNSHDAVSFERETGFRQIKNACYTPFGVTPVQPTVYCWQLPCSTILPCKPDKKKGDKSDKENDDNCIIMYR